MELLILLDNPWDDLEKFRDSLKSLDCSIIVENGRMTIKTSALAEDVDVSDNNAVSQVWEDVNNFVDVINGAAIVEGYSLSPMRLYYVKYIDDKGAIQFLPNIGNMYAVLPSPRASEPDISQFIPLALGDKAVAKALRLCSRELDWGNLYRIYEVISEDMGGLTDKYFKIVKASANTSQVTGDHSRHGKIKVGTPKETMKLADAQHLIKSKVREWIYEKIFDQSKGS